MIIQVKVVPNAKKPLVKKDGEEYRVYVTAPAVEGKANEALVRALAGHFGVGKSAIQITKGLKSRRKTIKIGN